MFEFDTIINELNHVASIKGDSTSIEVKHVDQFLPKLGTDINFISCLEKYINSLSPFFSSVIDIEQIELPVELKKKINDLVDELSLNENVRADVYNFIQNLYSYNSSKSIEVSKSNDDELIVFTFENETYRNALFDEDGDIEIIKIPKDKTKTIHKIFFKEENYNLSNVFRTFNAL